MASTPETADQPMTSREQFEYEANMLAGEDMEDNPHRPPEQTGTRQVVLWLAICIVTIAAALVTWFFITQPDCDVPDAAWAPCFARV